MGCVSLLARFKWNPQQLTACQSEGCWFDAQHVIGFRTFPASALMWGGLSPLNLAPFRRRHAFCAFRNGRRRRRGRRCRQEGGGGAEDRHPGPGLVVRREKWIPAKSECRAKRCRIADIITRRRKRHRLSKLASCRTQPAHFVYCVLRRSRVPMEKPRKIGGSVSMDKRK